MNALRAVSHRKVRCVAAEGDSAAAIELYALAMGSRTSWRLPDWNTRLAELDTCEESVGQWLVLNG